MWPPGHNLTLGGRELFYYGAHLRGLLTDAQVFSRALTDQEMVAYTACQEVADTPCLTISLVPVSGSPRRPRQLGRGRCLGCVGQREPDLARHGGRVLGGGAQGGAAHGDGYIYIISTYLHIYHYIYCTRCCPRTPAGPGAATCVGGSEAACTWTPRQPRHGWGRVT